MKRLLRYLNDYKKESVLAPLFKMLEASFELFVPLVVAQIVDVGIKNQEAGYILKMGGLLVLLGVIGLTCSITAQYFAAKSAVGFATGLRNDLFAHIGSLSYSEQDTIGTSTLITRMTSDINQVQSGVNLTLRLLLRFSIYRVWCHDHGFYRERKGSDGFCGCYSGAFHHRLWHHGHQYASV